MKLETNRLILRELTMEDFNDLFEILSDEETMKHYPRPFDEQKVRDWIQWNICNYQTFGFGLWAVVLKENNKMIGDCGITMQNIDGEIKPEIGYHINKKYQRQGYATEAAIRCRNFAFENTPFNRIYSYMKYTNVGSYSVALNNGMKLIKEYEDPKNKISKAYAISHEEWEKIK